MPASPSTANKRHQASEVIDVLMEISTLLNCHLTRGQLAVCVSMIEHGTNPEALATVIRELQKEAKRLGPPTKPPGENAEDE